MVSVNLLDKAMLLGCFKDGTISLIMKAIIRRIPEKGCYLDIIFLENEMRTL